MPKNDYDQLIGDLARTCAALQDPNAVREVLRLALPDLMDIVLPDLMDIALERLWHDRFGCRPPLLQASQVAELLPMVINGGDERLTRILLAHASRELCAGRQLPSDLAFWVGRNLSIVAGGLPTETAFGLSKTRGGQHKLHWWDALCFLHPQLAEGRKLDDACEEAAVNFNAETGLDISGRTFRRVYESHLKMYFEMAAALGVKESVATAEKRILALLLRTSA